MYGAQARFFQDEIRQDLKHKKKGMVAMASASGRCLHHTIDLLLVSRMRHDRPKLRLHARCTTCICLIGPVVCSYADV